MYYRERAKASLYSGLDTARIGQPEYGIGNSLLSQLSGLFYSLQEKVTILSCLVSAFSPPFSALDWVDSFYSSMKAFMKAATG